MNLFQATNDTIRVAVRSYCNSMTNNQAIEEYGPIGTWDTSNITDMSELFENYAHFNESIDQWNVSNVKYMNHMFNGASNFNQPLASWDVSKVVNMSSMFCLASRFNQPINSWDVSNVTDMNNMFKLASDFNQPLNSWNVSSVTSMKGMFQNAVSFNQNLEQWDLSNVKNMKSMFLGAVNFQVLIGVDIMEQENARREASAIAAMEQEFAIPEHPYHYTALDHVIGISSLCFLCCMICIWHPCASCLNRYIPGRP